MLFCEATLKPEAIPLFCRTLEESPHVYSHQGSSNIRQRAVIGVAAWSAPTASRVEQCQFALPVHERRGYEPKAFLHPANSFRR